MSLETTTAETLIRLNVVHTTEFLMANVHHIGTLSTTLNPATALDAQAAYVHDMGQRLLDTATENVEALVGAGKAIMAQVFVKGLSAGNFAFKQACQTDREQMQLRAHGPIIDGLRLTPGFLDKETGKIYSSCFADGRPAPVHLLDAIPEELVAVRDETGRPRKLASSVISGYISGTQFYTREEAAQLAINHKKTDH